MTAHRFKFGTYNGTIMSLGERQVDIRNAFADVPSDEMDAAIAAHGVAQDAYIFGLNILYLENDTQRILVDTGRPPGVGAVELPDVLRSLDISPESITNVIITHGHWDHIGGLLNPDGQLTYPNARYAMWKAEWDDWTSDEGLAQKNENNAENARKVLPPIRDRVDLIESESEFLPGISAVPAPGHTPGQIAVLFESGGERLLHVADALHQPIQIDNPGWSPGMDANQETSRITRRALIERTARENLLFLAYHFPHPGLGHIVEKDGRCEWQPVSE